VISDHGVRGFRFGCENPRIFRLSVGSWHGGLNSEDTLSVRAFAFAVQVCFTQEV